MVCRGCSAPQNRPRKFDVDPDLVEGHGAQVSTRINSADYLTMDSGSLCLFATLFRLSDLDLPQLRVVWRPHDDAEREHDMHADLKAAANGPAISTADPGLDIDRHAIQDLVLFSVIDSRNCPNRCSRGAEMKWKTANPLDFTTLVRQNYDLWQSLHGKRVFELDVTIYEPHTLRHPALRQDWSPAGQSRDSFRTSMLTLERATLAQHRCRCPLVPLNYLS